METITVDSEDALTRELVSDQIDADITTAGAETLWDIWSARRDSGVTDNVLIVLPPWYAAEELDRRWPYLFGRVEFDNSEKKAVLFDDVRMIDVNIVENPVWDDVTLTETLTVLDITDTNDYIDEQGKIWIPRSLMTVFERTEDTGDSNLTGTVRGLQGDD